MLSLPLDSTVAKEPKTALHKELRVVRETALQKIWKMFIEMKQIYKIAVHVNTWVTKKILTNLFF